MKKKLHIVTGNHRSTLGIDDITKVLQDVFGQNITKGIFCEDSKINLVIEDFSSPDYVRYLINSDIKIILVLTEFISLGPFKGISLNKFGLRSNYFILLAEKIWISVLRILSVFLPAKLKAKTERTLYWKNREVGLDKILKQRNIEGIICLHPEIENQVKLNLRKIPKESVFTIFPRLKSIQKNDEFDFDIPLLSYGSKNRYRKREIAKFNKIFPFQITLPNFEDKSITNNSKSISLFLDVYFKNSKTWPYLSPIRFWRTLQQGGHILYFGEEVLDHPINKCALRVERYEDFPIRIQNLPSVLEGIQSEIRVYDKNAELLNDKVVAFVQNLIDSNET